VREYYLVGLRPRSQCACVHVYLCVCVYMCVCVCMCVCVYACVCVRMRACPCMCAQCTTTLCVTVRAKASIRCHDAVESTRCSGKKENAARPQLRMDVSRCLLLGLLKVLLHRVQESGGG
jgi:hypothetical protein